jgi:hypothetical protein
MELAYFTCQHHLLTNPIYLEEYTRLVPPTEPKREFNDRLQLYGVKVRLSNSFAHPDNEVKKDMREQ